jgi:glycosyltransferase involved in cell wall biosynthesis
VPPRVTVCITSFNYAEFLAQAIDSALVQDYDDLEVIVVDDGSSDGSRSVIESYASRVESVFQPNAGQSAAVNTGFARSTGDVVFFLDSDDVLAPGAAAAAAREFGRDPELVKMQFMLAVVDAEGRFNGATIPRRAGTFPSGDLRHHVLAHRNYPWPPNSGNAYAASALRRVMPIPTAEYRLSPDLYLAETVPLCGRILSTADVGAWYRWHGDNASHDVGTAVEELHRTIDFVAIGHGHVHRLAAELGLDVSEHPADVADLDDVAYLGARLASLRLDPASHPIAGDTVGRLAWRGLRATWQHPWFCLRTRAKRSAWFVAAAVLPDRACRRLVSVWTPDSVRTARWRRPPRRRDLAAARRRHADVPADGLTAGSAGSG